VNKSPSEKPKHRRGLGEIDVSCRADDLRRAEFDPAHCERTQNHFQSGVCSLVPFTSPVLVRRVFQFASKKSLKLQSFLDS
jgi:hypothetical protein